MRISDWSSDVCSSALRFVADVVQACNGQCVQLTARHALRVGQHDGVGNQQQVGGIAVLLARQKLDGHFGADAGWVAKQDGQAGTLGVHIYFLGYVAMSKADRKSVVAGKLVSVRVDLSGRRIIKK